MATTLKGLCRNLRGDVVGSVRFEDDYWRAERQGGKKVRSVLTAWGVSATTKFGALCDRLGKDSRRPVERAMNLCELLQSDGPFITDAGYLTERAFDDGRFDSTTSLG